MGIDARLNELLHGFKPEGKGVSLGYCAVVRKEGNTTHKSPPEKLYRDLGIEVEALDYGPGRGVDVIWDLNTPIPDYWVGKYDFLINPGTPEHCFNVGMALRNAYQLVKDGGLSFHHGTTARNHHGYYNYTKSTFPELTKLNGELVHHECNEHYVKAVIRHGPPEKFQWPQQDDVR